MTFVGEVQFDYTCECGCERRILSGKDGNLSVITVEKIPPRKNNGRSRQSR